MKKLIFLSIGVALLASCQQQQTPQPAQPNPVPTMTTTESDLVGDWALRINEVYYNDTLVPQQTQTYNSPSTCYLNIDSTYAANTNNTMRDCQMAHIQCVSVASTWKMVDTLVQIGGTNYSILLLQSDSLVIQEYFGTNQVSKHRYSFNR